MSRYVRVASVQMQVTPADLQARLARAQALVEQAAQAGAQLVALPEVFNTGYAYRDENYQCSEPLDGVTVRWMRTCAARHAVHLAGSLLLRDGKEIYNTLLLVAPDGRLWRYDKRYPWGWERAYFRAGRSVMVAETALGRLGLMICWDVAHPDLWRQYAGQVDAMVICSCPPDLGAPRYQMKDGTVVTLDEMGPMMRLLRESGMQVFGRGIEQQSAWLGVPTVYATACGTFQSRLPAARASLLGVALQAPHLLRYLAQAETMTVTCPMTLGCRVLGEGGQVLAQRADSEEGMALAEIRIADQRPVPQGAQPRPTASPFLYALSDWLLPLLCRRYYARKRTIGQIDTC